MFRSFDPVITTQGIYAEVIVVLTGRNQDNNHLCDSRNAVNNGVELCAFECIFLFSIYESFAAVMWSRFLCPFHRWEVEGWREPVSGPGSLWEIQLLNSSICIVAWWVCSEPQENGGTQRSIKKGPRLKIIIELNVCWVLSQVFCKCYLS